MNFLEAVQALKDGRCEGIKKEGWLEGNVLFIAPPGELTFVSTSFIPFVADFLANDWQLVGEKPQVEEVEVVVYAAVTKIGTVVACLDDDHEYKDFVSGREGYQCVKLTGTYTREVPRKVKRREQVYEDACGCYMGDRQAIPINANLYAEWQEEVKP